MLEKSRIRKYYITGIIKLCQLSDFQTDEHCGGRRRRLPTKSLLDVGRQGQKCLTAAKPHGCSTSPLGSHGETRSHTDRIHVATLEIGNNNGALAILCSELVKSGNNRNLGVLQNTKSAGVRILLAPSLFFPLFLFLPPFLPSPSLPSTPSILPSLPFFSLPSFPFSFRHSSFSLF